jgi:hypothetical protein
MPSISGSIPIFPISFISAVSTFTGP